MDVAHATNSKMRSHNYIPPATVLTNFDDTKQILQYKQTASLKCKVLKYSQYNQSQYHKFCNTAAILKQLQYK